MMSGLKWNLNQGRRWMWKTRKQDRESAMWLENSYMVLFYGLLLFTMFQ